MLEKKLLRNLIREVAPWVEETCKKPATPWLVSELIPEESIVLLSGPQKRSGKTYTAISLGLTLGMGREVFPGFKSLWHGKVLYCFEEGSEVETAKRFRAVARGGEIEIPDHQSLAFRPLIRLNNPESAAQLVATVEELQPDLVVLDPFFRMLGGSENDSENINRALDVVYQIREKYRCSILILLHTRKSLGPGEDIDDQIRGSGVLPGAYDAHIALRPRGALNGRVFFETRFRDAPPREGTIHWDFQWRAEGGRKVPHSAKPRIEWDDEE